MFYELELKLQGQIIVIFYLEPLSLFFFFFFLQEERDFMQAQSTRGGETIRANEELSRKEMMVYPFLRATK